MPHSVQCLFEVNEHMVKTFLVLEVFVTQYSEVKDLLPFLGKVMANDCVQVVSHSPVDHILLQMIRRV
jgi:hypothetical protein